MVGHGGSSVGSYLADPTSPIPSHCASIVVTSTVRVTITFQKKILRRSRVPCWSTYHVKTCSRHYYPVDINLLSPYKEDKDKDLFIGPQEFVVGYSKAPEQPQSSARPICHSHAMTRTGHEPATIRIAA